ncbi:MAG TPA: glutathione S-transferase family protein [Rhizomicrobium sp.]|nr:glutathione S-transferase family protein [Rhizomicrobium sp.]
MNWIIYGDKGSGAFAAEAALAEAGAEREFREISLQRDEQRSPEFLAINPAGKIPALQLPEGEVITESLAMLLVIAERYPAAGLLPPIGMAARAHALRWLAFMASEIYPIVEIEDYPSRFVPEGAESEALREKAKARIRKRLLILERAVGGPWILAGGFSACDIYAAMFTRWSATHGWRDEHIPKLCAIMRGLAARPALAPVWQKFFFGTF